MLENNSALDVLENYDLSYPLEVLFRQYLIDNSDSIPAEKLKNFQKGLAQADVIAELAGEGRIIDALEVTEYGQGFEVTVIIGGNQCRMLTDQGGISCYI